MMNTILLIAIASTCIMPAQALRADINGDHVVDLLDLAILAEEWLMSDLGPNLVVNGGFDDAEHWDLLNANIAGGVASITESAGYIEQTDDLIEPIEAGKSYRITFTTVGGFDTWGGDLFFTPKLYYGVGGDYGTINADGTYTFILAPTDHPEDGVWFLTALHEIGQTITIDNVSVKEITNMTFPVKTQDPSPYAKELAQKILADLGPTLVQDNTGNDTTEEYQAAATIITELIAAFYELDSTNYMPDASLADIVTACTDV